MKKSYYFESAVDSNKVIETNGNVLLAHDSHGMLFWVDKYILLVNQKDAKQDKYLINGKWYGMVASVFCLDLRKPNPKQKLLVQSISLKS